MSSTAKFETPKSGGGFEDTIKDFWVSRPRRPLRGRKIGGVAAAVGDRYAIDPVIVRVALVAATLFGGAGLALYVLGYLFFADERDEVSPIESLVGKGRSSSPAALTVVLACSLFFVVPWSFAGSWFDGGGFFGLGLMLLGLYLLHRSRGQHNRPVVPERAESAGFDAGFSTDGLGGTTVTTRAPDAPPQWDPLGAAPFAWDLPNPTPVYSPPVARPPAPQRNSKVGPVTFAAAAVTAGVLTTLSLVAGVDYFTAPHIIGITLGVLGLGMVVGAFTGGGKGLVGWAIPLAIAGIALTTVQVNMVPGGFGTIDVTPRTVAEVRPEYTHTLGDIDVNLTGLPADAVVSTKLNSSVGSNTVIVPANADVFYTCASNVGDIDCLGGSQSGVNNPEVTGSNLGTDGAGGPRITLDVRTSAGSVEVRRG